jgi:hypothetical protein
MIDILNIPETTTTPEIILNCETHQFELSGRSLPEDPNSFYGPLLNWFKIYGQSPVSSANFQIKLSYFNTNSSKMLFTIFQMIDKVNVDHVGMENKIILYFSDEDEDLIELAEYYQELLTSDCLVLKPY